MSTDKTEPTAIVVASTSAPAEPEPGGIPIADDVVVVAHSAEEMALAQQELLGWVERKIATIEQDAAELQANIALATKRKWSTAPFVKALKPVQSRMRYYKTIQAALQAGYRIIPDMPGITLAVRTSRTAPRNTLHASTYGRAKLPTAKSDDSPAGAGEYVGPDLKAYFYDRNEKDGNRDVVRHYARVREYDRDFEFPLALVKPQILDDTNRAMLKKIFDEIAVVGVGGQTQRALPPTTVVGDPIVLGRVVRYEGNKRHSCAFLITWWLDTRSL